MIYLRSNQVRMPTYDEFFCSSKDGVSGKWLSAGRVPKLTCTNPVLGKLSCSRQQPG
jgi:hypothetical protein